MYLGQACWGFNASGKVWPFQAGKLLLETSKEYLNCRFCSLEGAMKARKYVSLLVLRQVL